MSELVSIIMPSYNTARFIGQSIRSVLAQSYGNWELIIVDDGSADGTDEVVRPFLADSRILYLKNRKNRGAAFCRNRALARAKGRWIAFLDSDDLWDARKLEKQVAFMENRGCHFSYTAYSEINEDGRPNGKTVTGPKRIGRRKMHLYCWPGCLTVMYDARAVGLIQVEHLAKNNDYAMWLRVCRRAECLLLEEDLAQYRRRQGSVSSGSYGSLIKWHYRLFRRGEGHRPGAAAVLTAGNLIFGCWKKLRYVKGGRL